jgi:hypothetical protein
MKIRATRILTWLWLALCLATFSLWAAGHFAGARVPRHLAGRWSYSMFGAVTGNISISFFHDFPTPNIGPQFGPGRQYTPTLLDWYDRLPAGFSWRFLGFCVEDDPNFEIDRADHMVLVGKRMGFGIPYWAAWVMWLPLFIFVSRRRRERIRRDRIVKGLCPTCGYDLRATPDRCPECGMIPLNKPNQV